MSVEPTISELVLEGEDALFEAAFRTDDFARARTCLSSARERARLEGDRAWEAAAADRLGFALHYENISRLMQGVAPTPAQIDAEETLFREAFEFREAAGDRAGIAQSSFGLGLVSQVLRRDWTSAMPRYWRALEIAEEIGDAVDLYTRSEIHRHVGFYYLVVDKHLDEGVGHLERSLGLRRQLDDPRVIPSGLVALGDAELEAGNAGRAVDLLEEAVQIARGAELLPGRIANAEQSLQDARTTLAAQLAQADA
jgi:tetratricopeptide (TPR) repeat protein